MVILGGMGTLVGPIVGAGMMQAFSQFLYTWFGARWPLIFGLIFILIVLFVPYGIIGTIQMKKTDIKSGWERFTKLLFPPKPNKEG
jgi:ABC-type branched-subunit amino acid transport system permease subunit